MAEFKFGDMTKEQLEQALTSMHEIRDTLEAEIRAQKLTISDLASQNRKLTEALLTLIDRLE